MPFVRLRTPLTPTTANRRIPNPANIQTTSSAGLLPEQALPVPSAKKPLVDASTLRTLESLGSEAGKMLTVVEKALDLGRGLLVERSA